MYYYGYGRELLLVAVMIFWLAFMIGGIILQGIGLYKMAKNAGIPNPWLAFIPGGNGYILGLLAERALYVHSGQQRQRPLAKLNLWLFLGTLLSLCLAFFLIIAEVAAGLAVLLLLLAMVASVGYGVAYFYSLYYVYKDYAPGNEVLLLVLSILLSVSVFIILIIYRNTVPVSVAGRTGYQQPRYDAPYPYGPAGGPQGGAPGGPGYQGGQAPGTPPPSGGPGYGYGQGYQPQDGYRPQYGPQVPQPPHEDKPEEHQGPEL